jgi:hypothetical protein
VGENHSGEWALFRHFAAEERPGNVMNARFIMLGLLAATVGAATQHYLPAAPQRRLVQVSPVGWYSEPAVAIDERNPRRAVVVYQVGPRAAYTRDGGRTWHTENLWDRRYQVEGDVTVGYAKHRAYLGYIAFDNLGTDQYWAHGATRNAIVVRRSPDGGKTWFPVGVPVIAHSGHPRLFEDKPMLVTDDTDSKYAGNVYIGWTQFRIADAQIVFSRSSDGGASFSKPVRISTHNGTPRDDNGTVEGFDGAVDSDGTLYVVWQDGSHIVFTSSSDGGRTFKPSVPILDIPAANFALSGFNVYTPNGFPQIDVDRRSHAIYVAWSDTRGGEADVFIAVSHDRGTTWSEPIRVNNDAYHDGADHFYDWMRVDHATGDVYVVWYDRRRDPHNWDVDVALARSTNGGATFANYAWANPGFHVWGQFIGDYTALAAYNGHVYGVWTESKRLSRKEARNLTLSKAFKSRTFVRIGEATFPTQER